MSRRPLAGLRIVDLTHVWAGPLCTRILADLGADVVKVEAPLARGSAAPAPKGIGIYVGGDPGDEPWNRLALFTKLNRGKRSVCVDLKGRDGLDLVLDLVAHADVVIENLSADALRRLGLGFDVMCGVNPRLLYVAMPGFGSSGPYRSFPAFGPSVEPMTGLGALLGYGPDEPRNSAVAVPDAVAGVTAAAAIVDGVRQVRASGAARHVEVTLHEAAVNLWADFIVDHQMGRTHAPAGNAHPTCAPHGVYPAQGRDQWLAIACTTDEEFGALTGVFGWPDDERFGDALSRKRHEVELNGKIAARTVRCDKHALAAELQAAGVAAGPVNTAPDVLDDPHLAERGYWADLALAGQPSVRYPGIAIQINGQAPDYAGPAPRLGEHNADVLADWLGRTDADAERLTRRGTLVNRPPG